MEVLSSPSTEALFIAGAMGAIAAMLVGQHIRASVRMSFWARLAYLGVAGYVAAFVFAPCQLYQAFVTGICLDVVLVCLRRVSAVQILEKSPLPKGGDDHD